MKQTKMWVQEFLTALSAKDPKIGNFFDQLVYGRSFTCLRYGKKEQIILYLNEDVPEMLVGVIQNQKEIYLNLRETQAIGSSSRHQLQKKITPNQYALLKHETEEVLFLFQGQSKPQKAKQSEQRSTFLQFFKFYRQKLKSSSFQMQSLLLYTFLTVDKNQNMTLQSSEIKLLLKKMKLKENEHFQSIMQYVRKEEDLNEGEITFIQFEKIMKLMQCRLEFKPLFEKLAMRKVKSFKLYMENLLPLRNFLDFLKNEQMESQQIIKKAQKLFANQSTETPQISFYDFSRYMVSSSNSIYDRRLQQNQQNISLPLTSYYCFSSHNTYLTGNQLTSDSKAQRYRDDLQNGYRCLEIDVHNGSSQPIVKHGFTMTSAVTFAEVIQTIAKFSNENPNHTPIILSLENHTGEQQQLQICETLKKYLGDKILSILPNIRSKTYPTLQQTMGKIIIKNSGNFMQYQLVTELGNTNISAIDNQAASSSQQQKDGASLINLSIQEYPPQIQQHLNQFTDLIKNLQKDKRQFLKSQHVFRKFIGRRSSQLAVEEIKKKIHPQMLKLTSILGKGTLKNPCIWESVSLNQNAVKNYFLTGYKFLQEWTDGHWIRSYPSSSRVDSSNYNPITALQLGIQLVAINSQSYDEFTAVMQLFFRKNKRKCTGYRLKSNAQSVLQPVQIKIRPISCSMLSSLLDPSSIPEVQVKMSFIGCAYDMFQNASHIKMEPFTQRIKDNAYNPIFQNPHIMHLKVTKPEFAFILLQVENCGRGVIAAEGLKKGYRHVSLLDFGLQERKGKVFLKVD